MLDLVTSTQGAAYYVPNYVMEQANPNPHPDSNPNLNPNPNPKSLTLTLTLNSQVPDWLGGKATGWAHGCGGQVPGGAGGGAGR